MFFFLLKIILAFCLLVCLFYKENEREREKESTWNGANGKELGEGKP